MQKKLQARRTRLAHAVSLLVFAWYVQAAQAQNVPIDIPAQPLNTALRALADQFSLQLAFSPAQVQGKQARRVHGLRDPRAALNDMLQGTGLQGQLEGSTLSIRPLPAATHSGEAMLAPVVVTEQADRSGTTEGTGPVQAPLRPDCHSRSKTHRNPSPLSHSSAWKTNACKA